MRQLSDRAVAGATGNTASARDERSGGAPWASAQPPCRDLIPPLRNHLQKALWKGNGIQAYY